MPAKGREDNADIWGVTLAKPQLGAEEGSKKHLHPVSANLSTRKKK